jgi:hypothetical protein
MPDGGDQPGQVPDRRDRTPQPGGSGTPQPSRCVRAAGFVLRSQAVRDGDRISVAGELTVHTAVLLDVETVDLCRLRSRASLDLVLDLTEVTFVDAMGVEVLRRVHHRTLPPGGLRLGLPVATVPGRLLALAIDFGLLPPVFRPSQPRF